MPENKKEKIENILVKHISRPQKQRYLLAMNDGCCLVCGHPFGTKEVRKRIKCIVDEIMEVIVCPKTSK